MTGNRKLDALEQLLRDTPGVALRPGFRRGVLDAIARLPDPLLLPAAPRVPFKAAAAALLLVVLGALALVLPHNSALLAAWDWDLADTSLALSIGDTALSASLFSVLAVLLSTAVLTAVGLYSKRNHLIGA